MDVGDCRTVHRLPSSISRRFAERRPGSIGHITLRGKCAGARSAGKPHAACDVAGAGNGLTVRLVRHSHRKRRETDRPRLRSTAPALDPTGLLLSARPMRSPAFRSLTSKCYNSCGQVNRADGTSWPSQHYDEETDRHACPDAASIRSGLQRVTERESCFPSRSVSAFQESGFGGKVSISVGRVEVGVLAKGTTERRAPVLVRRIRHTQC